MIILDFDQRSGEWVQARLGVPSASNFHRILTPGGKPSGQKEAYLWELIGERMSGIPKDSYVSQAMKRGIETEESARLAYEIVKGVEVQQVGFCFFNEDRKFGSSPDGLVNLNGGIEIKFAEPHVFAKRVHEERHGGWNITEFKPQVQGNLLVTSRQWWDLVTFNPSCDPPILIKRMHRDSEYLAALSVELREFVEELELRWKEMQNG